MRIWSRDCALAETDMASASTVALAKERNFILISPVGRAIAAIRTFALAAAWAMPSGCPPRFYDVETKDL